MAEFLLMRNRVEKPSSEGDEASELIGGGLPTQCRISGAKGTFRVVRDGVDAIASIGYACHIECDSAQETLVRVLKSFQESQIGELKKALVGQYVLVVKKGDQFYVFSDLMGARNIFYSDDCLVASSSLVKVENRVQISAGDLDEYKVMEYLAMRHVLYPTNIGNGTHHRRIKWLLPYEYLVFNTTEPSCRVGSVVYRIDNSKVVNASILADDLVSSLRRITERHEFKSLRVAASLTGGRDSRLVAAVVAEQFGDIRYRTSVSNATETSVKDLRVAEKLARLQSVPLDVYRFDPGRDGERFLELTEGFAPLYNHSITPLIEGSGLYALGFGGVYGTELFMPIAAASIDEYIQQKIQYGRRHLLVGDDFWEMFRGALYDAFAGIKAHYKLSQGDERDYIRLFNLFDTARYSSFILSAFNRNGYQLEPYGSYSILDLALRVAPELWGNHRRLAGDALVQKTAMGKLNSRMARIMTYSSFRPMVPLSAASAPRYLLGYTLQVVDSLRRKVGHVAEKPSETCFPAGTYVSDGWARPFLERASKKYGFSVKSKAGL